MVSYLTRQRVKSLIPEGPLRDTARLVYRQLRLAYHQMSPKACNIRKSLCDGSYALEFRSGELAGRRLILPPADFLDYYFMFSVSEEICGYFQRLPREIDLIMDIGSFPGDFAVLSAMLFGKKVYAFEPDPTNFGYLKETIYANGLGDLIDPLELGVSDIEGETNFISDGVSSRICSDTSLVGNTHIIKVTTVNTFMNGHRGIPLIKMDIEGHEIKVVQKATRTLKNGSHWSIASYHLVDGEQTCPWLERFFQQHGYQTERVYPKHLTLNAWNGSFP